MNLEQLAEAILSRSYFSFWGSSMVSRRSLAELLNESPESEETRSPADSNATRVMPSTSSLGDMVPPETQEPSSQTLVTEQMVRKLTEEVETAREVVTAAIKANDGSRQSQERKLMLLRTKLREYQRWQDGGLARADS